jgi:hypothetical protein
MVIRSAFSTAGCRRQLGAGHCRRGRSCPPERVVLEGGSCDVTGAVHRIGGAVLGLRRSAGGVLLQVVRCRVRVPGVGIVRLRRAGIALVYVDLGFGHRGQARDVDVELEVAGHGRHRSRAPASAWRCSSWRPRPSAIRRSRSTGVTVREHQDFSAETTRSLRARSRPGPSGRRRIPGSAPGNQRGRVQERSGGWSARLARHGPRFRVR